MPRYANVRHPLFLSYILILASIRAIDLGQSLGAANNLLVATVRNLITPASFFDAIDLSSSHEISILKFVQTLGDIDSANGWRKFLHL